MVKEKSIIKDKALQFYRLIKNIYPVKKIIIYGSYARGDATNQSDIDIGVVLDISDHSNRIEINAALLHYSSKIDTRIEPRCIYLDEYQNSENASIIAEVIRNSFEVV